MSISRSTPLLVALAALCLGPGPRPLRAQEPSFLRGDANGDGVMSISDALMLRRWLFQFDRWPTCLDAADVNDSGGDGMLGVDIADVAAIIASLYLPPEWAFPVPEPYPLPGFDPTDDGVPCESYTVQEPEFSLDDIVRIGEVEGAPGDVVEVPVYLTSTVPVEAFQLVVAYDPSQLTPLPQDFNILKTAYGDRVAEGEEHDYTRLAQLAVRADEGYFLVGVIGHLIEEGFEIPPGTETPLARLPVQIGSDVAPETEILLTPTNGEGNAGLDIHRLRNELTHRGEARFASILPEMILGKVKVISPDFLDYLPGDSNDDATTDLSDAVFTLNFLFLGGEAPTCPDAADADDDGDINITDAIFTLGRLFLSREGSDDRTFVCRRDLTRDALGECSYSHCK